MTTGFTALIVQQVLLGHVGDVGRLDVLSKQVVVGLIFYRAHILGNRKPPLFAVAEGRVDIEDDAPERMDPMADNVADSKAGFPDFGRHRKSPSRCNLTLASITGAL